MEKRTLLLIAFAVLTTVVGCGTATTPTPLPTVPPQVITVIVTATLPPPTATSAAPTVTPMPTLPLTSTVTVATPTTQAAAKPTTAARAATRTPTKPAVTHTATLLPIRFGAPSLTRPIWTDNQKDQATFPGGAIVLDWQSVGGLGGDECYLVQITTEPVNPGPGVESNRGDYWVDKCGDQTAAGYSVKFTLEPPRLIGAAPNYSSILLNTDQMWATWTVTVVKNLGQCDPSYKYHCKTAPISPPGQGRFLFKGG